MLAEFLPKPLDGIGSRKFVVDRQSGKNFTDIHWHDCIEIIYLERGSLRVFFNNKWHSMSAGDMVLLPPHRVHCVQCDDENAQKTVVGISKELICDSNITEQCVILPFETDAIKDYCFFKDDGQFSEIFKNLNCTEDSYYKNLIMQAEILRLYACIYADWQKRGLFFIEPIADKTVYEIINILEQNYSQAPSAYEMARHMNMSYSNMSKILNARLGTNYNSLLTSIRIENAKKLLLSTDRSITQICFDCGFQSSSYFVKTFRQKTGVTPLKFRARASAAQ